ncbi:MAG: hypothetical protein NXH82_10765 [Rhodobacteraceae bacterium]|nr:hypothetical protein [Paracoccaceae bacterium]
MLALFGPARWTRWHARPELPASDRQITLWVSTNSLAAVENGATELYVRAPW